MTSRKKAKPMFVCDGRNDSATCRECEDGSPHEARHNCSELPCHCCQAGRLVRCRPVDKDGGGK